MTTKPPIYYISDKEIETIARAMAVEYGIDPDAMVSNLMPQTFNRYFTTYFIPANSFPAWKLFIDDICMVSHKLGKLLNVEFVRQNGLPNTINRD